MARRTLTDDDIEAIANAVAERVAEKLGLSVRHAPGVAAGMAEGPAIDDRGYVGDRIADALDRVRGLSSRQRPRPSKRTWRTPTRTEVKRLMELDVESAFVSLRSGDTPAAKERRRAIHLASQEASRQLRTDAPDLDPFRGDGA